ncbi:MAG TPA: hypothetical protein VEO95_07780, partial [Chthoniobacteraceae bacterium]|nr:hypothetical protein [Chthoniobacteraceae bacterium]
MSVRALLSAAGVAALLASAHAVSPAQRTDSGQFTIYCDDANLRRQVAGFAARTRGELLELLDEPDQWRRPIVVTIELNAPSAAAARGPVEFRVVETEVGMKIEIVARIGSEPADVNL